MQNNQSNSDSILKVTNLRRYFRMGSKKKGFVVKAVDNLSFEIKKGEVFGLVGESGCGKTTTGRTILGLYQQTDGTVEIDGKLISAGYSGYEHQINLYKKEFIEKRNQILLYNIEREGFCNEYKQKIARINERKITAVKKTEEEYINKTVDITKAIDGLYLIKNKYKLLIDEVKYGATVQIKEVNNSLNYTYETQKKIEINRANFILHRKIKGIKESAAIEKIERLKRINDLKIEYKTITLPKILKDLDEIDFDSGVASVKINTKKEANEQIKAINVQKSIEIKALNAQMNVEISDFLTSDCVAGEKRSVNRFIVKYHNLLRKIRIKTLKIAVFFEKSVPFFILFFNTFLLFFKRIFISKYHKGGVEVRVLKKERNVKIAEEKQKMAELKSHLLKADKTDIQMIFQDPIESLNPRMTIKEIVSEGLVVKGIKDKTFIHNEVVRVLDLVGLNEQYMSRYPHEFSGGQRQRIGIARALIVNPKVLVADEPVSALDVSIQAQVINLLFELREKLNLTILFVAHDLSVVKYFCDRIAVMYSGKIVELATYDELFENPLHPHTKSLLASIPEPDPIIEKAKPRKEHIIPLFVSGQDEKLRQVSKNHYVYGNEEQVQQYLEQGVKK